MSSFAFSHQFSQHWITTLPAVKNAIIQELDDIAKLLHPDSNLAEYEFSVPDLNAHVEEIITQETTRLAKLKAEQEEQERLEQERLNKERLAREQEENARLVQIRREEMRLENERLEKIRLEKESLEQQRLTREKQAQAAQHQEQEKNIPHPAIVTESVPPNTLTSPNQSDSTHALTAADENFTFVDNRMPQPSVNGTHPSIEAHPIQSLQNTNSTHLPNNTADSTNSLNPSISSKLSYEQIKQEITTHLNQQMEDYIQESMQIMRNDLRPWVESEVEKQLVVRLNHGIN